MAIENRVYRQDNERALSEVIGFILLLGVLVAAIALWMMYVVPANGREDEITQMNAVKDRFTDYKISLDSLWVNNNQSQVTLSTSFNLGTGGGNTEAGGLFMPLLNPVASSAVLSVKDTGDRMTINTSHSGNYTINMSMLEYQSQNNYWIQQRYYYQTGGVFLSQDNGATNRISPPFTVTSTTNKSGTVVASVNLVPISLIGSNSSIGGNGPVRVDTWMRTPNKSVLSQENNWMNVSVNVADQPTARMWTTLFKETLARGGMDKTMYSDWSKVPPPEQVGSRWVARISIFGPYGDVSNKDVFVTLPRVEYVVTLNNVASEIS
ncbi:MAG: hypothetical protein Q7T80_07165 [Methanoregula sp.]|nr:hypothetical protein [Methanoregula sp.]